jgi:flagellar hook-associated protein 3 FlgL
MINQRAAIGNRVTGHMVNRRFVDRLQTNFARKNESENRIISQRRFTRASQNPLDAARTLRTRRTMSEVETYKRNLDTATGIYEVAESNVRQVSSILAQLHGTLIKAATGTYATDPDKQIIALEIDGLADQMMRLMNVTVGGRRIFGGVHNIEPPFEINMSSRTVYYNGVNVNTFNNHEDFPHSRTSFLDVGLGMKWFDAGTLHERIDPQTAIPVTFNGAQILGSGTKEDGVSNNLIQLALDAATSVRAGTDELTAVFADLVFAAQSSVSFSIARIGSEQAFIDFNKDRILNLEYSLAEQQNKLEFIDMGEETTRWKMLEMIYNATLQMSASTVPMSIFNFIR